LPFGGNLKTEANKKETNINKKRNIPKQPKPATDGKHLLTAGFLYLKL